MLEAIFLGIVEGITEFLPISSSGHLLVLQQWVTGRSDLFDVAIQAGAIVAVTIVYRQRLKELVSQWRDAVTREYLFKLGCSFALTAVLGPLTKFAGIESPQSVLPVAAALLIGGVVILFAERLIKAKRPAEQITWAVVISVGLAQVVAGVFPGTSRTGAAIFAAMFAGLTARGRATEFAFLVGIPTMFVAASYEFIGTVVDDAGFEGESWTHLAIGFTAAAVTGFIVVKWVLGFISSNTFVPFAWYRIVLGVLLLFAFVPSYHQNTLWLVLGIGVAIWAAYVAVTLSRRDANPAPVSVPSRALAPLSEPKRSELTVLVSRASQVLEDLGSTRCESEAVRQRAAALQVEIAAWLASNADASAADMFKSVTGVPGIVIGMAPQYIPMYQRFRGRMKVLQQLARIYSR